MDEADLDESTPSILIDGKNIWEEQIVQLGSCTLAAVLQPASVNEPTLLHVYEVVTTERTVSYATARLSNGRQGIFLPAQVDDVDAIEAIEPEIEGYWRRSRDEASELPWPVSALGWTRKAAFLEAFDRIEGRAFREAARGFSRCRLCDAANGREELQSGYWRWPEGFRHYVAQHDVRPSKAFEQFVMTKASPTTGPAR